MEQDASKEASFSISLFLFPHTFRAIFFGLYLLSLSPSVNRSVPSPLPMQELRGYSRYGDVADINGIPRSHKDVRRIDSKKTKQKTTNRVNVQAAADGCVAKAERISREDRVVDRVSWTR